MDAEPMAILKVIIQRKNSAFLKRKTARLIIPRNIGLYKLGESHFPQKKVYRSYTQAFAAEAVPSISLVFVKTIQATREI